MTYRMILKKTSYCCTGTGSINNIIDEVKKVVLKIMPIS